MVDYQDAFVEDPLMTQEEVPDFPGRGPPGGGPPGPLASLEEIPHVSLVHLDLLREVS